MRGQGGATSVLLGLLLTIGAASAWSVLFAADEDQQSLRTAQSSDPGSKPVWQTIVDDLASKSNTGDSVEPQPSEKLRDPPQCKVYPCPPSTVMKDMGTYKKVYFPEAPYAKSRVEGKKMPDAFSTAYKRLRGYTLGKNDMNKTLKASSPIIFRIDAQDNMQMFSPENFTMFFFIDQSAPWPKPENEDIDVLMVNSYTLYIRTFYGYTVTYADFMRELFALAADVEANNEPYETRYYYFASYDPPTKMTGRVNEVQLLKPHPHHTGL